MTVVPLKTYFSTFAALMVLLVATVIVAYFDLGRWNLAVAMAIAVAKAILIILFFMHVRYGRKLIWVFAAAGFFWLGIMLFFALTDYATRPKVKLGEPASPHTASGEAGLTGGILAGQIVVPGAERSAHPDQAAAFEFRAHNIAAVRAAKEEFHRADLTRRGTDRPANEK